MSIAAETQAQAEDVPVGMDVIQSREHMVRSEDGQGQVTFAPLTGEVQDVSLPLLVTGGDVREVIMIISAEELRRNEAGQFVLDEQLWIELGAACALYGQQIILVWQSSIPPPDDLRDLHHCCLHGHDLTLENGLHFMQLIKKIQRPADNSPCA